MKKIMITFLLIVVSQIFIVVSAQSFTQYLPGGKNYLNPVNLSTTVQAVTMIEPIKVKSNTTYTISFPGFDMIGEDVYLLVEGEVTYIDDLPMYSPDCDYQGDIIQCSFTTTQTETTLDIMIMAAQIKMYVDYYEYENFQLEEGTQATTYEPYIEPYIDTENPVFSGSGGFITSYQESTPLSSIIGTHIVAYDEIDGDLTHLIQITSDTYTGNELIVGEYNVSLQVEDYSGNQATFQLTILVKDEIPPVIIGDPTLYTNVSEAPSLQSVLSSITYYDEVDPSPSLTILQDLYTGYEHILGDYLIEIEVKDIYQNKTTSQHIISVQDIDPPTVSSNLVIQENINQARTVEEIIQTVTVTDNYDQFPTIKITEDLYTESKHLVGTYFVTFEVADFSGNKASYTLQIHIEDLDQPVINGPSTIQFSYINAPTIEELKALYTITDNVDTLDSNSLYIVEETYSTRTSDIGTYMIVFGITDSSLNETTIQLDITLIDDVDPIIFIDEYIVVLQQPLSFTQEDALKLLIQNYELIEDNYEINVIEDEYTMNKDEPGEYKYTLEFINQEGESYIKEFYVVVEEQQTPQFRYYITGGFIILFSGFVIIKKKK